MTSSWCWWLMSMKLMTDADVDAIESWCRWLMLMKLMSDVDVDADGIGLMREIKSNQTVHFLWDDAAFPPPVASRWGWAAKPLSRRSDRESSVASRWNRLSTSLLTKLGCDPGRTTSLSCDIRLSMAGPYPVGHYYMRLSMVHATKQASCPTLRYVYNTRNSL